LLEFAWQNQMAGYLRRTVILIVLACLLPLDAQPASIDDVTFLKKIETHEAIVDTTLVTQEGKRIPITRGTRLNVAGFTETEAFVISRKDKPNGFVRKKDIAPIKRPSRIKEETLK